MNKKSSGNNYPIIFVHGILGWGPEEKGFGKYWGTAHEVQEELKNQGRKIEFASVGPVSSYWDRARELFYQIKGGKDCVYYCKDYDKHHVHNNPLKTAKQKLLVLQGWEKSKKPLYEEWSKENPIHLVGHSQGAWTILLLQYMLEQGDLFPGHETDASWIRSVTSISGVLNGTTVPYAACHFDEETGYYKGTSSPGVLERRLGIAFFGITPLELLKTGFHGVKDPNSDIVNFLSKLINNVWSGCYNWDLDQWGLTRKTKDEFRDDLKENDLATDIADTYKYLTSRYFMFVTKMSREDFIYGQDNAGYSLSVIGTISLNKLFRVYKDTYYFSYVTRQNYDGLHFFLKRFAEKMYKYPIANLTKTKHWPENKSSVWPKIGAEDDLFWRKNDGLVPVISQTHPWLGVENDYTYKPLYKENDHYNQGITFWPSKPEKQTWYAMKDVLDGWDHTDIIAFHEKGKNKYNEQYQFYRSLCLNLNKLPE